MLLFSIIILLLSNAVTLRRDKSILYSRTAIFILIYTSLILYFVINIVYLQKAITIYNGLLYCKNHTIIFTMFIFILTAFILLLTSFYPRKIWTDKDKAASLYNILSRNRLNENYVDKPLDLSLLNKTAEQFKIIEYPLIILFIITGGTFLMSSSDLVSIFLSIELQSYGLYLLCSIYRNSELATNAGLTYFLLGGLSSCIILLGQSLLYINSGNTYLDAIYIINSIFTNETLYTAGAISSEDVAGVSNNVILTNGVGYPYLNEPLNFIVDQYYIQLSMVILSIGFLFKVSAAPFHFWSPDVYDAIPTVVTTFVAIIAKITIFIFFLELVYYTSITSLSSSALATWNNNLILSSLLSLIIGSVLGLTQYRIKRLFAYSTISHVGFILLALSINSIESIQAFYFYLIQYSITNLNAFMILIAIGYSFLLLNANANAPQYKDTNNTKINKTEDPLESSLTSYKNKNDKYVTQGSLKRTGSGSQRQMNNLDNQIDSFSPIQFISQIKGFFFINPVLAISLAITIFSFVGVPPLIGFFAKQMILSAALDNGYLFMSFIAILTSVIGAVYYLAIIKELFFERSLPFREAGAKRQISYPLERQLNENNRSGPLAGMSEGLLIKGSIQSIFLSGSLTITISILTLFILGFIFMPKEFMSLISILGLAY